MRLSGCTRFTQIGLVSLGRRQFTSRPKYPISTIQPRGVCKLATKSLGYERKCSSKDSTVIHRLYCSAVKTSACTEFKDYPSSSALLDAVVDQIQEYSTQELSDMLHALVKIKYIELIRTHPWAQNNIDIAFIQMTLNNDLHDAMADVLNHQSWGRILQKIDQCHQEMSSLELSKCMQSVFYLGMDHDHEIVTKLYCLSRRMIPEVDLEGFENFSCMVKMFGRDFQLLHRFLKRHLAFIDDEEMTWTHADIQRLAKISTMLLFQVSKQSSHKIASKILQLFDEHGFSSCSTEEAATYIRFLGKAMISDLDISTLQDCREKLKELASKIVEEEHLLEPGQIAEVCHSLKKCRCYTSEIAQVMQERALHLIKDTDRLADVSNLSYALTRKVGPEMKRQFETRLFSALSGGDIDLVVMSNISDSLAEMKSANLDLHQTFQSLIAIHADSLVQYISRLHRVLKYLLNLRQRHPHLINRESENILREVLLKEFKDGQHLRHANTSTLSLFLLPSTHKAIPHSLHTKLLQAIPRLRYPDLYKMSLALNTTNLKVTSSSILRKQMSELQNCLHSSIGERIDDVPTLDYLYQLTLGLVIHNRSRDPSLTTKILHTYTKFSHNLTDISWAKVVHMFLGMKFHLPEIMDDFTEFIITNKGNVSNEIVELAVDMCSSVGYIPKKMSHLIPIVEKVMGYHRDGGRLKEYLFLLKNMSILNWYPEHELTSLFQLDFLEEVDKYIDENTHLKRSIEKTMFELNKNVLLECPQLDVPWFHEEYCKENIVKEDVSNGRDLRSRFNADVEEILTTLLGGAKYFRKHSYSPYFYHLNFDCVMNEESTPVLCGDFDVPIQETWTRVAFLPLMDSSFCYNSRHLTGVEQQKQRHLEIMGFKVVQIPHFDWYSMAMGDKQSKVEYIQEKLFDSN